ncbi:MAG: transposase [Planctomycetaceae bacterium]|nr:transposase [Planctomycetaceae bacterium]
MTKTESAWRHQCRSLPPPVVREVLVRYGSETNLQAGGYSLEKVRHFQKVLGRVTRCRTGELGSAHFRCGDCGNGRLVPSPCGNRHCAGCSFVRSNNWKDDVLGWNVQCEYQHLVFTLPHLLNPWLRKYSRDLYNLLIRSVRDTLLELHAKAFGCVPGALLTLHTWGQRMNQHVHVHVILTGGGLSLDGTRWVNVDHRSPLLSREALAAAFKQMFLRRLKRQSKRWLADKSDDSFDDASATKLWHELTLKTWMVNNQSPPEGKSGPDAVVNYLARYVAGVAISDSRIVSDDGTHVSFRCKNYQANTKTIEKVSGEEFVKRFCLHILPKNFSRVRTIGLFRPQQRDARLALVRHLIAGRSFEEFEKLQAKAAANRVSPLSWTVPTVQLANTTESEAASGLATNIPTEAASELATHIAEAASGLATNIADEAKSLEWQLLKEQHTQARIAQWAPTTIEQDLQIAVQAILPTSTTTTSDSSSSPTSAASKTHVSCNEEARKTSLHGKRLGPSEWRSKYNGCRQCGEQMERLTQRSQHLTKSILKAVGKLLLLLSVMPWDVMIEFLQQLRGGRVDRSRWPVALQEAMAGTTWFDKWLYQAIYWYLIEQIAERLKSGELRNPKIYEFNPDAVYDPKRHRHKQCDKHEPKILPTGIPPPGKKTSRKIT